MKQSRLTAIHGIIIAQLSLAIIAYGQIAFRAPHPLIGVTPTSETFNLAALERPNVSTNALLSWATLAATATFTFDFVNYQSQLDTLQDYFTKDGYAQFLSSIQSSDVLSTIQEKKLILSAVAIGPAIVISEEIRNDIHTWKIQLPLLVRYQSANVDEKSQQIVDLLVTQVSTQDAPKGIGIAQYIARESTSDATN